LVTGTYKIDYTPERRQLMKDPNRSTYKIEDEEMEIDLRQIINVLKKWRKLIIVMTLLCGFAAGILSFFVLPPIYQAQTLLMVTQATDKLQATPTTTSSADGENLDNLDNVSRLPVLTMSTYLGQLKSEALMNRIIKKLHLNPEQYNASALAGMIDAQVVQDSNLIQVNVTSPDRLLASRIANTLSDEYLKLMTEKNQEQMSRSVAFLEKQKKINDKELDKAEEKLKELMSQPRGVAVLEAEFTKLSEDSVNANSTLKTTRVEIQQLNSSINVLTNELASTSKIISVDQFNENTGNTYKSQEVNPVYVTLSQQLSEKKTALAEKQGQYEALNIQVGELSAELDAQQADLAAKKLDQDKLQSEVDRLKKTSETLAQKGTETQISKSIDLGDTSVIVVSAASIPTSPVKPNKTLNIAIALVLGLIIFTLLAFLLEYMDNTLKTPEDIARELELPVLGMIPKITNENSHKSHYGG
jgi:capsular polysaccharide biosynthesis protein